MQTNLMPTAADANRIAGLSKSETDVASVQGLSPLAFSQERLWFINQTDPAHFPYNGNVAIQLRGRLNTEALQRAIDHLVQRHEAFRTVFVQRDGTPYQAVKAATSINLSVISQSLQNQAELEREVQRLSEISLHQPFDLEHDTMLRAELLRYQPDAHVLLLTISHIAMDNWSVRVFLDELAESYNAIAAGQPISLGPEPLQLTQYARWQRERLAAGELDSQLDYWRNQLKDAVSTHPLVTDYPRPKVQTYEVARESIVIPLSLVERIKRLGQTERCSLFMTLLAGFFTLLHRQTSAVDLTLGTPIANRNEIEIEKTIGFLANTLVMRVGFNGNPDFRTVLRRVRETCLDAYDHQDIPFEKVVEALQPERYLNLTPLFQTVFVFENGYSRALPFTDLEAHLLDTAPELAKFDLMALLTEQRDGIRVAFDYNIRLFEPRNIRAMQGHFLRLLEAAADMPDLPVGQLAWLADDERRQILFDWNQTASPYPQLCVHEIFLERAREHPDAVALVNGDRQLTYGALNRLSNRVAAELRKSGVQAEARVGVAIERSIEMIVCLLGILKAGAAYVPLDPADPPARLHNIVQDSGLRAILTHSTVKVPRARLGVPALNVDEILRSKGKGDEIEPPTLTTPDSLAYVMYTSGSTGEPKGVEVPHRAIVRLLCGVDYARFDDRQVFLQLAPLAFDASTFEIWGALMHGGKLVQFPNRLPMPAELESVLSRHGVTTLWLTSSLFNTIIDEAPAALKSVGQLLTGGEALSVAHVCKALKELPDTRLVNGYGPTEGTTFSCCFTVPSDFSPSESSVPIGKPIANTRVYILDPYHQPVPPGVQGELYIGGDGLARGYIKNPETTLERFTNDPFCSDPGARLYRTGDAARYRYDGAIEFLGRLDLQVKIRGFRIEPEEIENCLQRCPGVQNAGIAVSGTEAGKELVAGVVLKPGSNLDATAILSFLQERLPAYMLPARIEFLEQLPLTLYGKLDRAALVALCPRPKPSSEAHSRPWGAVESRLAQIWSSVLGTPVVDVDQDFFELGGHSLLAVKLMHVIERQMRVRLPISTVFEAPTVASMAAIIQRRAWTPRWKTLVPVQTQGSRIPFFCVHGAGGATFRFLPIALHLGKDQPFYGIQAIGLDGREEPLRSVEAMAAKYIEEMRQIQPSGPYLLGGFSFGGAVAFEMAQQLVRAGEKVGLVALIDTFRPRPSSRVLGYFWKLSLKKKLAFAPRIFEGLRDALYRITNNATLPKSLREVRRACQVAGEHYKTLPYPGRLTLFRARGKSLTSLGEIEDDWKGLAMGGLQVFEIDGGHNTMTREPNVRQLAACLRKCIDEVERATDDVFKGNGEGAGSLVLSS